MTIQLEAIRSTGPCLFSKSELVFSTWLFGKQLFGALARHGELRAYISNKNISTGSRSCNNKQKNAPRRGCLRSVGADCVVMLARINFAIAAGLGIPHMSPAAQAFLPNARLFVSYRSGGCPFVHS